MSHGKLDELLVRHGLGVREPGERPVLLLVRERAGTSSPSGVVDAARESETATTVAPSGWSSRARFEPDVPEALDRDRVLAQARACFVESAWMQ